MSSTEISFARKRTPDLVSPSSLTPVPAASFPTHDSDKDPSDQLSAITGATSTPTFFSDKSATPRVNPIVLEAPAMVPPSPSGFSGYQSWPQASSSTVSSSASTPSGVNAAASITPDSSAGIFATTGGPPLILVFLAAALLVGAVLALLVLRRLYPQRGGLFLARPEPRKRSRKLGERPVLWDLYLDGQDGGEKAREKWEDVKPISARFVPVEYPPPSPLPTSRSSRSHTPYSSIRKIITLGHPRQPMTPSTPSSLPLSSMHPDSKQGILQVSLMIAMPRPHSYHLHEDSRFSPDLSKRADDSFENDGLDHCLGISEIPWSEDFLQFEEEDLKAKAKRKSDRRSPS